MRSLIAFFINNRVAANMLAIFLVLVGYFASTTLVVRLFPDINLYSVNITVPYPGATPEEVEEAIVEPIEERISGLEGVRKYSAVAAENVANIVVELYESEDVNELTNDIRTEVSQITVFPEEAEEPQIGELESSELIAQVVLSGPVDTVTLKKTAQTLRNRIAGREGVSRVDVVGVPEYLIEIEVSEPRMQALGLSLPQLADTIGRESLDLSGGEIEGLNRRTLVRTLGENEIGEEFREVVVASTAAGSPIRLGAIADINDGLADSPLETNYDERPAVVVNVYRVGAEKVFSLIEAVREEVERLQPDLPPAVETVIWRDQSLDLQSRIDLLVRNAIIGLILVTAILLLFLDVRIAFWVAVGVGISFAGSLILMALFGISINQLTLFGFILAIGIVVDDAIVVGENIYTTLEEGEHKGARAALVGAYRVARPVLFAISTTICAFLPLLFLPGQFGQFLGAIAAVVIFVLLLSLTESFFILPQHVSHIDGSPPPRISVRRFTDPLKDWTTKRLDRFSTERLGPAITWCVKFPLTTLMIAFGALFATFTLMSTSIVKFDFFPEVEGNYVTATVVLAESASDAETRRATRQIVDAVAAASEKIAGPLKTDPEDIVEGTLWSIGQAVGDEAPGAVAASGGPAANAGYAIVKIQDAAVRKFKAVDFEQAWREATGDLPGAQELTFSSDLVGGGADVTLELTGPNEENVRAALGRLREEVVKLPGTYAVRDDRFRTTEEFQIRLLPTGRSLGLTNADVASQVRAAYFGAEAVRVQRDREEVEVRVRYSEAERQTVETIRNQRIRVADGYVPLSQVATVEVGEAPSVINRENGARVYTLRADVDLNISTGGAITSAVFQRIWPEIQEDYPNVSIGYGGDQEEEARSMSALGRNFLIAMFAIYTLLALSFGSYTQPLIVLVLIPFGLIGALWGHALLGINLTLLSLFGIIGLSGVIINDALLMVDYINEALEKGVERGKAIVDSAVGRFRPIILTSVTTFLGVTPIISEQSVQAAFLVPTAVSLGFGILFGTFILMLVVPAAASLHGIAHDNARWLKTKGGEAVRRTVHKVRGKEKTDLSRLR